MQMNGLNFIRIGTLILAAVLIISGFINGSAGDVLAKAVRICTLLDKPTGRKVDLEADYVGFEVPDAFIVGYGLDFDQRYRQLPYISFLKQD